MKRFLFIFFIILTINSPVFSQLGVFTQRGRATREMSTPGFAAAHNNIPLNSIVKVTNSITGKEIEVTIVGRILMSSNRIIDLSYDAWYALDLTEDIIVVINYTPVIHVPEPAPDLAAIAADAEAKAVASQAAAQAAAIIIAAQAEAQAQADAILAASRAAAVSEAEAILAAANFEAARAEAARAEAARAEAAKAEAARAEAARAEAARAAASQSQIIPRERRTVFPVDISEWDEEFLEWLIALTVKPQDIRVIPELPAPDSGLSYRLHVGSYTQKRNADRAERLLNAMGFTAGREIFNEFTRVYIVNISAKEMFSVIQRLGAVGFRTIWIREHELLQ